MQRLHVGRELKVRFLRPTLWKRLSHGAYLLAKPSSDG